MVVADHRVKDDEELSHAGGHDDFEGLAGDDEELEAYIEAASNETKQELVAAFNPHFDGLWKWHQECEDMVPQPDELVMFDTASNAAATIHSMLDDETA